MPRVALALLSATCPLLLDSPPLPFLSPVSRHCGQGGRPLPARGSTSVSLMACKWPGNLSGKLATSGQPRNQVHTCCPGGHGRSSLGVSKGFFLRCLLHCHCCGFSSPPRNTCQPASAGPEPATHSHELVLVLAGTGPMRRFHVRHAGAAREDQCLLCGGAPGAADRITPLGADPVILQAPTAGVCRVQAELPPAGTVWDLR